MRWLYGLHLALIAIASSLCPPPAGRASALRLLSRRASLDEGTLWRLSLRLARDGHPEVEAVLRVRFLPDRGYEPPQGRLFVEDDLNGLVRVDERGLSAFRWTLSEDKDDRKDGLWVWGLFREPNYPFLYTSLAVFDDVILPSGEAAPIFGGEGVPSGRVYLRFSHRPDKELGTVLSSGEVSCRLSETARADPLGLGGSVEVGEFVTAGSVQIQPVFTDS